MRKFILHPYPLGCMALALVCLVVGFATGWIPFFSIAVACFAGTLGWSGNELFRVRRNLRDVKALDRRRSELSDLAVSVLELLDPYSNEADPDIFGFLPGFFSDRLEQAPTLIQQALDELEGCKFAGYCLGTPAGFPAQLYYRLDPEATDWLAAESTRRDQLLEQAGPAPGPRSRPSELSA
jgi:hypothetical protein